MIAAYQKGVHKLKVAEQKQAFANVTEDDWNAPSHASDSNAPVTVELLVQPGQRIVVEWIVAVQEVF